MSDNQLLLNNIDLKLLRVFKTVVEANGMTNAANELGIGLASVSKQVSDLEIRMGMTLCSRGRGGFRLTKQGVILYEATLELFSHIHLFRDKLSHSRQEILGELNIGLIDNTITDAESLVTAAVQYIDRHAPKVDIRLQIGQIDDIERSILEGRYNCGIYPVYEHKDEFDYFPLYQEQAQIYCGRTHSLFDSEQPITMAQLGEYQLINHTYANLRHKEKLFKFHHAKIQATQVEAVAMLILTGCYLGYLPIHYAQSYVAKGELRAVGPSEALIEANMCFVVKKGRNIDRLIRLTMQALGLAKVE